ncbi:FXSXX-COOH protein [Actinomadura mexicana]|uniref:FXSXX-COOH protein n=1 Tax=Actinomadura mexicana TaxID=134959 RepID=A0A238UWU1_9ACTN|nr:FXSXX-COOH protein [Actinomadura mexicana]SNR26351.1 FXSXX-COOH protein [Actinomadura mexicana]
MPQEPALHGELIDVSGLSLRELDGLLGESAIELALREILDPNRGEIASAGFESKLG